MKQNTGGIKMSKIRIVIGLMCILLLPMGIAQAGDFYVYPEAGQSQDQTEKDKYECMQWAKGQSNFDPMATPTASTPPPQAGAPQGGAGRGAVRGGLLGVGVGAIAGDAGKGAAIGAVSGGLLGGMRRRDQAASQQKSQDQWAQQQAAQYQQGRNNYNRAYKACLEGRKYSVK
jgi:hypothetical protein